MCSRPLRIQIVLETTSRTRLNSGGAERHVTAPGLSCRCTRLLRQGLCEAERDQVNVQSVLREQTKTCKRFGQRSALLRFFHYGAQASLLGSKVSEVACAKHAGNDDKA